MALSLHAKSIRTITLAMAFGNDSMTLLVRGKEPRVAKLDRARKLLRDALSGKYFGSPFAWALDCYETYRLSTSKLLLIGGKTVGEWTKKMRKDQEMRIKFHETKLELLSNLNFMILSSHRCCNTNFYCSRPPPRWVFGQK
jgi:hypothetical protein